MTIHRQIHCSRFQIVFLNLFVCLMILSGCAPSNNAAPLTPSSSKEPQTQVPQSTSTPTPTATLQSTPTPQAEPISLANWNKVTQLQTIGDGEVLDVLYSADGKNEVIVFNHAIRFLEKQGDAWQETKRVESAANISAAALSPDGNTLVVGKSYTPQEIKIWNARTGEEIQTLGENPTMVIDLEFSMDGSTLITSTYENDASLVRFWNTSDWTLQREKSDSLFNLQMSPGGKYYAEGNSEINVYKTGNDEKKFVKISPASPFPEDAITAFAFSPDDEAIAYLTQKSNLSFYRFSSYSTAKTWQLKDCSGYTKSVVYSKDGGSLTVACGGSLQSWNLKTGTIAWNKKMDTDDDPAKSFLVSGPGTNQTTAVMQFNQKIEILVFDTTTGNVLHQDQYDSLPWCFNQTWRDDFIDYLRTNWDPEIQPLVWNDLFTDAWSDNSTTYTEDENISPDGTLAAYYLESKPEDVLVENFILRKVQADSPIIASRSTTAQTMGNKDEYAGIGGVAFSADSSLVSATFKYHVLTWNTSSGELLSDINVASAMNLGNYIYFRDIVYAKDGMLIGALDSGELVFMDPAQGKFLGVVDNGITDGHFLSLNHAGTQVIMSSCGSFSMFADEDGQSNRTMSVFGIPLE